MSRVRPLAFILILSLLVSIAVAKLYIPFAVVGWDESVYLMWAYRIYNAVRQADIAKFWQVTFDQFNYYPPLQSWILGIILIPIGFSIETARIVGLLWLIMGSILVFLLGKAIGRNHGVFVGTVSSLLYLTSPMVLSHSAIALKEMMGGTLTILALLAYTWVRTKTRLVYYVFVGILLFTLTLAKYNYGVLLAGALLMEALVAFTISTSKERPVIFRFHLIMYTVFGLLLSFWLLYPTNRIPHFIYTLSNPFPLWATTDLAGYLLFYPRAILLMYSASVIIGSFLLLSLILAVLYMKNFRIRILWFSIVINLIVGEIHTINMEDRYIFTTVPALFILGTFVWTDLITKITILLKRIRCLFIGIVIACVIGIKLLLDLFRLPNYVSAVGGYSLKFPVFNQLDYVDSYFNYNTATWPHILPSKKNEKPDDVIEYIVSSVDLTKSVDIIGFTNEFPPDYVGFIMDQHKNTNNFPRLPYSSYLVTIEILPTSRYYTKEYLAKNAFALPQIRKSEQDPTLILVKQKTFEELGVRAGIYAVR